MPFMPTTALLQTPGSLPFINVKDAPYRAAGDGVTDDTAAIQAALNDANAAGGGAIEFPAGVFRISSTLTIYSRTSLTGQGRGITILKKTAADFDLIDVIGATGAANHRSFVTIRDLSLHGNDRSGALLRLFYGNNFLLENVRFETNTGGAVVTAELWDSKFSNCTFEWVSSRAGGWPGASPAMILQNSAAAAGVGLSTDNTNQIQVLGCRFENNEDGDLVIRTGTGGSGNPNGFYFTNCKFECAQLRNAPRINVGNSVRGCHFLNTYIAMVSYSASSHGNPDGLYLTPDAAFTFENALCYVGVGVTTPKFFLVYANSGDSKAPVVLRNLWCNNAGTISTAFVSIDGGTEGLILEGINATAGTVVAGAPVSWGANSPVLQKAGAVADGDFPYAPPDGTMGLDTTNHRLYIRDGGLWKYATLT